MVDTTNDTVFVVHFYPTYTDSTETSKVKTIIPWKFDFARKNSIMIMSIDPLLYEEYFSSYFNSIVEAPNYIDPEFVIIDTGSKTGLYDLNGNTAVTRLCREDTYSEIYNEMGHFFIIGLSFVRSNSSNYDRNTPAIYTETTLNISSCVFGSRSDNQNFGISVKGSAMGHDYYAPFFRVSYCSFIESSNEDNYVLDFQCLPTHRVSPIINNNYSVDNNFFLLADVSSPLYIDYDGFVPGIVENPQSEIELNQFDENSQKSTTLIGYYLKDTNSLFDVIPLEVLDKLTVIKCQDWAAVNIANLNQTAKSTWLTSMGQTVVNPTISYGDAIELVHEKNEDINFHWNTSGTPVRPEYIDLPSHFDYEQEAGYMPIICELDLDEYDDGDKPIEVAIFVDEICKGAEVIKSDQVILKAYIVDDPSLIGKEVTFQLYFSHTKAKKELDNYLVMDFAKKVFISRPLTINPQKSYEFVTFKDIEYNNNIPQVNCLLGNYPNPFNPETTINFFITEKTTGSLKIFNLRGQLVNTVINKEAFSIGYHKVTWNGKDSSQHRVSSGIYFYRLETEQASDVGKMILLK